MRTSRQRPTKLFVRVAFYLLVMAAVFIYRGQQVQRGVGFRLSNESDTVTTITLVGRNLAPRVVPRVVSSYHRDYPRLHVLTEDGGTTQALEAIANRPATVGLLYRPPTRVEQAAIRAAVDDSVVYFPIALGGIAVLVNAGSAVDSLTLDDLRGFLNDEMNQHFEHFYAPDPNQGLWDAFRSGLGIAVTEEASPRVVFLKDEQEVVQAVAADPRGVGVASTLDLPDSLAEKGVRVSKIKRDAVSPAVDPAYEKIGYGEYPLYHYLYVACLANRSVRAAMFVTQLTSDRGQRQIERAGVLPARQTARPIVLTRNPIGSTH